MNAPTESRDLAALERELEQLKQQLPRHSTPPSLLQRIEELEEAVAARRVETNDSNLSG